jgi:hypothetical protein
VVVALVVHPDDAPLAVAAVLEATGYPFLTPYVQIFVGCGEWEIEPDSRGRVSVDRPKRLLDLGVGAGEAEIGEIGTRAFPSDILLGARGPFTEHADERETCCRLIGQSTDRQGGGRPPPNSCSRRATSAGDR